MRDTMFLEKIEKTNDIKEIGAENHAALAEEIYLRKLTKPSLLPVNILCV